VLPIASAPVLVTQNRIQHNNYGQAYHLRPVHLVALGFNIPCNNTSMRASILISIVGLSLVSYFAVLDPLAPSQSDLNAFATAQAYCSKRANYQAPPPPYEERVLEPGFLYQLPPEPEVPEGLKQSMTHAREPGSPTIEDIYQANTARAKRISATNDKYLVGYSADTRHYILGLCQERVSP
jgi:hypothetical protein